MSLPPPKIRDLAAWIGKENPRTETNFREAWEIGVPAKKSLSWSIVLSILFSESNESFDTLLKKITGDESEVNEIKCKKQLSSSEINADAIEKKLKSFNPFKNRHSFFHCKEVSKIVRIFNLRLNRYAEELRSRTDDWNDDLKLKAASELLVCRINVYFPERTEAGKFITYQETPENFTTNIILFQYENQQHGERNDPINIFSFAMKLQQAHILKLGALRHFLKKAKIDNFTIDKVIKLMSRPEAHGAGFLPTILENSCVDILPEIYRSPYIAIKLKEAGFQTDPIARISDKPSPLCYALTCSTNPTYLQILYDYASNCRCLFDRSVRSADDTVLEELKQIKSVVETDISKVSSCNFEKSSSERAVHILKQLNRFIDYQSLIASNLINLKKKFQNREIETFQFRKEVIETIIEHYLIYFRYEEAKSGNISQEFSDFINFSEYYDYTDNFFYISFFDNFYKLKRCFGLKEPHRLPDVERRMFIAVISNYKYFPKFVPENTSDVDLTIRGVLRHIPLYHRNEIEKKVNSLLKILKDALSCDDCVVRRELEIGSRALPQFTDELILSRLNYYMKAVQEVSPKDDGLRAVLVIERAMQVIGESIKPSSSMESFVSFLLRSCLPSSLQKELIDIRNDLSHYRSYTVFGKLTIENDTGLFEGIKDELKKIQDAFDTVYTTQYLRTEESVMCDCLDQLKDNLESNLYDALKSECELHLQKRRLEYKKYHRKCIELLLDSVLDLYEQAKNAYENLQTVQLQKEYFFSQLKSIEYLLEFIGKNMPEKYLNNLLSDLQEFVKLRKVEQDNELNEFINNDDQLKEMKDNGRTLNEIIKENKDMKEIVNMQLNDLQQDLLIYLTGFKEEILKYNPEKKANLIAPNIQSFFKSLKKNMFLSEEIEKINSAVEDALKEAVDAKIELENMFKSEFKSESFVRVEELLRKILIPSDKISEIWSCYEDRNSNQGLKYLKKCISEDLVKSQVQKMLESGSLISGYGCTILTKIVFQRNLSSKFYASPKLSSEIYEKLEDFLTKKVSFFLTRLKIMKNILIDEDEEIHATWKWGRSEAIKYHLKYLMRQRYMREATVCASLEMAYFDCVNIFHKQLKENDDEIDDRTDSDNSLANLYEKSGDLFAGIDLRNIVSHRSNFPEAVGGILDEDDFPTEMIAKILELIDDAETIEAILELFKKTGVFEKEDFVSKIKNEEFHESYPKLMKTVTDCRRWESYLCLFPFIKTLKVKKSI